MDENEAPDTTTEPCAECRDLAGQERGRLERIADWADALGDLQTEERIGDDLRRTLTEAAAFAIRQEVLAAEGLFRHADCHGLLHPRKPAPRPKRPSLCR
jgi:hypothetical protein